MTIVILGAGAIGQAIASVLSDKKVTIEFWDKDKTKVPEQKPLAEVITKTELVFICVPSFAVRAVAESIAPYLNPRVPVVSVSKGLEPSSHKTADQLLQEMLPQGQPIAMLCGPMLADEMNKGMPAIGTVGTKEHDVFMILHTLFSGTLLRVEHSVDIHGVAVVSVLKNVYAIGVGIGEGIGYGDNWRGWFMNQALNEMITILKHLGGAPFTVHSAAGLGDFIATGSSPYSRNHTVGQEIGARGRTSHMSEGLQALPSLMYLLGNKTKELPILSGLQRIILDKEHAKPVFQKLFRA